MTLVGTAVIQFSYPVWFHQPGNERMSVLPKHESSLPRATGARLAHGAAGN